MMLVTESRKAICRVLIAVMLVSAIAPGTARAGVPADDLKQIEYKYYFRGKYQQAIEALQTFLARVDLEPADATRAQEFMAASYVLGGAPAMGKDVFLQILAKTPEYAGPDPTVFKLEVMNAYGEARSEYVAMALKEPERSLEATEPSGAAATTDTAEKKGKPIYKQWWLYAGVAAAALAAGLAAGGGDGGTSGGGGSGGVSVGVTVR